MICININNFAYFFVRQLFANSRLTKCEVQITSPAADVQQNYTKITSTVPFPAEYIQTCGKPAPHSRNSKTNKKMFNSINFIPFSVAK